MAVAVSARNGSWVCLWRRGYGPQPHDSLDQQTKVYDMLIALAFAFVFGPLWRKSTPFALLCRGDRWRSRTLGGRLAAVDPGLVFVCLEFGYVAGCVGRARWDAWRRRDLPRLCHIVSGFAVP